MKKLTFCKPEVANAYGKTTLASSTVAAGFPSPAEDFYEDKLDLNELLVKHPASTFFVRVRGISMTNAGIKTGDILVVDKALAPLNGSIVIAIIDNEFTVKRLVKNNSEIYLKAENNDFKPIKSNFEIWGVVTHIIKEARLSND